MAHMKNLNTIPVSSDTKDKQLGINYAMSPTTNKETVYIG